MNTIELLERAIALAEQVGFGVRYEWLGGSTSGGSCEVRGRKWLFLDPTASPQDHLEIVAEALRLEPASAQLATDSELRGAIGLPKAA